MQLPHWLRRLLPHGPSQTLADITCESCDLEMPPGHTVVVLCPKCYQLLVRYSAGLDRPLVRDDPGRPAHRER